MPTNQHLNATFGNSINSKVVATVKKEKFVSDTAILQSTFNNCITNHLPVALYKIPGQNVIHLIHQEQSALLPVLLSETIASEGFLIHPFDRNEQCPAYLIRSDVHLQIVPDEKLPIDKDITELFPLNTRKVKALDKKAFEGYIDKAKKKMGKGRFEKIVAAKCVKIKRKKDFDPIAVFVKACNQYPNSFVSCVCTNETGLWIGASPEVLLNYKNGVFTTYSLAGTRPLNKKKVHLKDWGLKERREQQIVTGFIESEIRTFPGVKLNVEGPETAEAGSMMHLKTTFSIIDLPHYQWNELVTRLHPTPAVCGMPKEAALEFIKKQEKDRRAYYSGFLGPVNINDQINLYVNLRCMEIQKKKLLVHVGCGITAESDASAEWVETELKSQTMISLLENPTS